MNESSKITSAKQILQEPTVKQKDSTITRQTANPLPQFLQVLLPRIKASANIDEALTILNQATGSKGLTELQNRFFYKNYRLEYHSDPGLDDLQTRLKALSKIDLGNSYAKPIAIAKFNNEREAYLTVQTGAPNDLIPYSQAYNAKLITSEHVEAFLENTKKLLEAGFIPQDLVNSEVNSLFFDTNSNSLIHTELNTLQTQESNEADVNKLLDQIRSNLTGQKVAIPPTNRLRHQAHVDIPSPFRLTSPNNDWETTNIQVGNLGANKNKKIDAINKELGQNTWRFAWHFGNQILNFRQAIKLYEESYFNLLSKRLDYKRHLQENASDIYDTSESNTSSQSNYFNQEDESIHLQDIAIRRVMSRLNTPFQGSKLVQIRSNSDDAVGKLLSPLNVPFCNPSLILKRNGNQKTVEDFWQLNRIIQFSPSLANLEESERAKYTEDARSFD